MFTAAFRCDNCERHLQTANSDGDEDDTLADPLAEAGWFTIFLPNMNEAHLCGERCLTVWAATRAIAERTIET